MALQAKYPGTCTCGATFKAGARIHWEASIRRTTGCPTCCPRAVAGTPVTLSNGLCARFDRHPTTGEVILCLLTDPCGAYNASEVYALRDGKWSLRSTGREMVLSGVASHDQVEGWRSQAAA